MEITYKDNSKITLHLIKESGIMRQLRGSKKINTITLDYKDISNLLMLGIREQGKDLIELLDILSLYMDGTQPTRDPNTIENLQIENEKLKFKFAKLKDEIHKLKHIENLTEEAHIIDEIYLSVWR